MQKKKPLKFARFIPRFMQIRLLNCSQKIREFEIFNEDQAGQLFMFYFAFGYGPFPLPPTWMYLLKKLQVCGRIGVELMTEVDGEVGGREGLTEWGEGQTRGRGDMEKGDRKGEGRGLL